MKVINCEQLSEEWFKARLGVPSASNFHKVVTPTGKQSSQLDSYVNALASEIITGSQYSSFASDAMLRGQELEPIARASFEFEWSVEVEELGFCMREDIKVGCSPDGMIQLDNNFEGLEIKCPLAHNQLSYLRDGGLPTKYMQQVQGSMYVMDFDVWNFYSYHPDFAENLSVKVYRDEEFIKKLADTLTRATDLISECVEKFKKGDENVK